MGQEVEVRPGIIQKDAEGRVACTPIYSRIVSLFAEQNALQFAVPGGLIGVGTTARASAAPPAGLALCAMPVLSRRRTWQSLPGHDCVRGERRVKQRGKALSARAIWRTQASARTLPGRGN